MRWDFVLSQRSGLMVFASGQKSNTKWPMHICFSSSLRETHVSIWRLVYFHNRPPNLLYKLEFFYIFTSLRHNEIVIKVCSFRSSRLVVEKICVVIHFDISPHLSFREREIGRRLLSHFSHFAANFKLSSTIANQRRNHGIAIYTGNLMSKIQFYVQIC